jgi:hypothetical protein
VNHPWINEFSNHLKNMEYPSRYKVVWRRIQVVVPKPDNKPPITNVANRFVFDGIMRIKGQLVAIADAITNMILFNAKCQGIMEEIGPKGNLLQRNNM